MERNATMLVKPKQIDTSQDIKMVGGKIYLTDSTTAAAVSLGFGTDITTGLYRTSAGVVGISVGGTSRLSISTAGVTTGSFSGPIAGNATTATTLATSRSISMTGDVTWTVNFDGSAAATAAGTLATTGVVASTYRSVTVDAKGRVTAGTNPTTLAGYAISDAVNTSSTATTATANRLLYLDANAALPASVTGNAATATILATSRTLSFTGDATGSLSFNGSANASAALTLATVATAGTYTRVTVNAKGLVTAGDSTIRTVALYAGQLESPNNSGWAVNSLAGAIVDSVNTAMVVRNFDDTTETGVGFYQSAPTGSTNLTVNLKFRAATAPASGSTNTGVVMRMFTKLVPDNAAVGAWSAGTTFTTIAVPTVNAYYRYYSQTFTLATLGITAGSLHLFELTRYASQTADNLVGDIYLVEIQLVWS